MKRTVTLRQTKTSTGISAPSSVFTQSASCLFVKVPFGPFLPLSKPGWMAVLPVLPGIAASFARTIVRRSRSIFQFFNQVMAFTAHSK